MKKTLKKSVSILLSLIMVFSLFTIVPLSAGAETNVTFVKVTEEPDDWSGDYLIVYENGNKAFDGGSNLNSAGNCIDVTISNGEIAFNDTTDAAKVTIAQIDGGYSIATAGGIYIGGQKNTNKIVTMSDAIVNTISLDDEDYAVIVSNETYFRYNSSWGGFRYYKSVQQQPVTLYKLEGGSSEPEPDPDPAVGTIYDSGDHEVSELNTGDYIVGGVESFLDSGCEYTITLKAGTYTDYPSGDTAYDSDFTAESGLFDVNTTDGILCFEDWMDGYIFMPFVDGAIANAFYVESIENGTVTLAGANLPAAPTTYKVTWYDWDGYELGWTNIEEGEVPDIPFDGITRDEDADYTYELIGWTDSSNNFYEAGTELPAVTGDIAYTATYEATAKPVIKNGPNENGWFYINDVRVNAYKLVEFEGDWYFVAENHKYAVDQTRYLSAAVVEGTPFTTGYYDFGTDGKMTFKHGPQDNGWFYSYGVRVKAYNLVSYEDNYYFVAENHKIVKNARRYLNAAVLAGTQFPAGYYDFDADGKMIIKNGLYDDGLYYIDGVRQNAYQLISYENNWYFIAENHKIAKNQHRYLSATVVAGTDFTVGYYDFDSDGKMILP